MYKFKSTGRAAMLSVDLECAECGYFDEYLIDNRRSDAEIESDLLIKCPNCDHEHMERVYRTAPSVGSGDPKSDKNLARMQRSLRERFVKKEIDEVRHRTGKLYDDSIMSAAAQRIKKGEKPTE